MTTPDHDYGLDGPCTGCGMPFLECDCPFDDEAEWIYLDEPSRCGFCGVIRAGEACPRKPCYIQESHDELPKPPSGQSQETTTN